MAAKNDILIDKDGNQIFPATMAEQVSYDGKINVKQAIKRGAVRNKVAPTVASMTDKEQIYVYTGTEEGYTFGNWYYWDGTAWTSGGAYNAIEVNTDGTLTEEGAPADAKATGDKLSELKDDISELDDIVGHWKRTYEYTATSGYQSFPCTLEVGEYRASNSGTSTVTFKTLDNVKVSDIYIVSGDSIITVTEEQAEQIAYITLYQNTVTLVKVGNILDKVNANTEAISTKADITDLDTKVDKEKTYIEVSFEYSEGYVNNIGNVVTTYGGMHYFLESLTEGDKYKFQDIYHVNSSYPAIVGFDADGNRLYSYNGASGTVSELELIVPSGVVKFSVNIHEGHPETSKCYVERALSVTETVEMVIGDTMDYVDFDRENAMDSLLRLDKRNPFTWNTFDKAYFSFMNDDGRSDMYLFKNLCDSYGIPYANAIPRENAYSTLTIDGLSYQKYLKKIVDDGGELFVHQLEPLTSTSTEEDIDNLFRKGKKTLEDAIGVKIRGIIQSGGTGYSTFDYSKAQRYSLFYYDYSDAYGTTPQYKLARQNPILSLYDSEDEQFNAFKALIDDAVANHKWVRFFCHGTSEMSIELLTRVFDYIESLGSVAEWVSWGYMYDTFGN